MIGASWIRGQPRERHASRATTTANATTGTPASLPTEVRFNDALVGLDDAGRPLGNLVAVVEDEHNLAQPHHDLHVVLHEQHRPALVAQPANGLEQVVEQGAVDAGRRLVEEDQRRVAHQHPDELDELLLAVGEIAGVLARQLLQLHERKQLASPALGGGPIATGHHQEVFQRRELGKDARAGTGVCKEERRYCTSTSGVAPIRVGSCGELLTPSYQTKDLSLAFSGRTLRLSTFRSRRYGTFDLAPGGGIAPWR